MYISKYFTQKELIYSDKAIELGIDNFPSPDVMQVAILAAQRMDVVRELLGTPISISSWIRILELNRALKSKDTSKHLRGEAIDFTSPRYGTPLQIAHTLHNNKSILQYDQLILEHTWLHISWAINPPREPRMQTLSLLATGKYALGITDKYGRMINASTKSTA